MLQSLPENGPIDDQLFHLEDVEGKEGDDLDNNGDKFEDSINSNFIPASLPSPNEERSIDEAFVQMQTDKTSYVAKY